MDDIVYRHKKIIQALTTLESALHYYEHCKSMPKEHIPPFTDYDDFVRTYRDSMIQRFEYCVDFFWKYLKKYSDTYVGRPGIEGPNPVIRASFAEGFLTEQQAEQALDMVKDRNATSHIYKEEIAELLAKKIPGHFQLMTDVLEGMAPKE